MSAIALSKLVEQTKKMDIRPRPDQEVLVARSVSYASGLENVMFKQDLLTNYPLMNDKPGFVELTMDEWLANPRHAGELFVHDGIEYFIIEVDPVNHEIIAVRSNSFIQA